MIAFLRSRKGLVLLASLAIAAFFLITEHRTHLSGFLPYALLALFVVLHMFMHAGHGGHPADTDGQERPVGKGEER